MLVFRKSINKTITLTGKGGHKKEVWRWSKGEYYYGKEKFYNETVENKNKKYNCSALCISDGMYGNEHTDVCGIYTKVLPD